MRVCPPFVGGVPIHLSSPNLFPPSSLFFQAIQGEMEPQKRRMELFETTGERLLGLIRTEDGEARQNVAKALEGIQDR